jgi:hypothetical protein
LTPTVSTPAARALAQQNNVRLIDGDDRSIGNSDASF